MEVARLQGQGDAALVARGPQGQPAREVKSTLEPAVCYKNQTICSMGWNEDILRHICTSVPFLRKFLEPVFHQNKKLLLRKSRHTGSAQTCHFQVPETGDSSSVFAPQVIPRPGWGAPGRSWVSEQHTNPDSPARVVHRERKNIGVNSGFMFPGPLGCAP